LVRKEQSLLDQHIRDPFAERLTSHGIAQVLLIR
jgi:hypothetical protein